MLPRDHKILIHLIHHPIHTLGPGKRVGIWLQGCHRHCPGCIAPETWDFNEDKAVMVSSLIQSTQYYWINKTLQPDGITLSGGEPLDQYEALCSLLSQLYSESKYDILLYTGYSLDTVHQKFPELLKLVSALVCGPYIEGQKTEATWKGSENQTFFLCDSLYASKYQKWTDTSNKKIQFIQASTGKYYLIGIPRQEDTPLLLKEISKINT